MKFMARLLKIDMHACTADIFYMNKISAHNHHKRHLQSNLSFNNRSSKKRLFHQG